MDAVLTSITSLLTQGITGIAQGVGSGLTTLVTNIFLDTSGTTTQLSTFGGVIIIFAGVALAINLCKWVVHFVTSFGR